MSELESPHSLPFIVRNWRTWLPGFLVFIFILISFSAFAIIPVFVLTNQQLKQPFFLVIFLVGIFYIGSAIWIFLVRRHSAVAWIFSLFGGAAALAAVGMISRENSQSYSWIGELGFTLASACLIDLALLFPQEEKIIIRRPYLRLISYAVAGITFVIGLVPAWNKETTGRFSASFWVMMIYLLFAVAFIFFRFFVRRRSVPSPIDREQFGFVLSGLFLSFGPPVLWTCAVLIWPEAINLFPYILIPLIIFPLTLGYGIQCYRLVHTEFMLSRAVLYGLMAVLVSVAYALIASGLGMILTERFQSLSPVFTGLIFFTLGLGLIPFRQELEKGIRSFFFRGEKVFEERLLAFTSELTNTMDLDSIIVSLRQAIEQSLLPDRLHIFIYDSLSESYRTTPDLQGKTTSDLVFLQNSPLPEYLLNQKVSFFLDGTDHLPGELQSERLRIRLLGGEVFIPLPGRKRLAGWIVLGLRISGEVYTSRDFNFLDRICDQAALVIERAQVVVNLESRIRQMNVLSRVAQGINITLTMDDILELVYAQTSQIIPADDFKILLVEIGTGVITPIFSVVNNERSSAGENVPYKPGQSLEQELINQRCSMVTDDYSGECQKLGIVPADPGLFTWMGIPLNAGAGPIGAISVGSRNPTAAYNQEQLTLFQAIGDQAAGAITKARLFQETQRRTRQLSSLNEVTRKLTSTLDQEQLWQNILKSAVEILNCEAGSLFLVDSQSEEVVCRIVEGPISKDFFHQLLAPGEGLVEKAMKTRQPIAVNPGHNAIDWSAIPIPQAGIYPHPLLVVALEVKDRVIGAIIVMNKRDNFPFSNEDKELLSAFAAQAAVAIENARLYTMTDKALAARVDELSVMQRIDRELNTSLDTHRAMSITLEWALRQTNASSGLVGTVEGNNLTVVASSGYSVELDGKEDVTLAVDKLNLNEVVETGAVLRAALPMMGGQCLLNGGKSRIAIPIRRESTTIGLILLESITSDVISEDALNFLMRLSDHASIAISNAQLYGAVQAANLAKSDFVSFVSHELKNPMTSIKGYSELLAAGAVGPVNEAQANFLFTIRTNVDRMATLVSDLNDVSRIEAGRLRLDFRKVDLKEVIEEVLRSFRKQEEEKNQKVDVQLSTDLTPVWADRTRVLQILTNLASNAYKYSPSETQILIKAETTTNLWDCTGADRVVHIQVRDSGIGIAEDDQKRIFQKYFRSEDPKTRESPGTGLGLNITKSLIELQGGRIWFESEYRIGTVFHFTLPVAE